MNRRIMMISALLMSVASLSAQTDYTDRIKNPGFESPNFAGWTNKGYKYQTNDSPTKMGWTREGTTYAEKWSSTPVENGYLIQTVEGLPDGYYVLSADGHAVLEDGGVNISGVNLLAGYGKTSVNAGKTYCVGALVTGGKLKIGIANTRTGANWVAVDNFRLTAVDTTVTAYRNYLKTVYTEAKEIETALKKNKYYESDGMKKAIKDASFVSTKSKEQVMEVLKRLETELDDYARRKPALDNLMNHTCQTANNLKYTDYEGKEALNNTVNEANSLLKENISSAQADSMAVVVTQALADYLKNRPSEWVTIKNGNLWKTNKGATVQAHAPGFVRVGDVWYMVGEDRSNSWNPDVNLYSSTDLVNWKYEKKIIQNGVTSPELGSSRMIERAKLMYNEKTGKFVVWCHWEASNYGASEAACFTCDRVDGAYQLEWSGRPQGIKSRDCNVFVDHDGTAYFISTTEENQHLGLFQLDDDYLSTTSHTRLFGGQRREAPAIVRIGDNYFMFSSACSGWDPNQCKLSYSQNLKDGWSGLWNVGNSIAYDTQAAAILTIKGTKQTTYLYVGDRWQDPDLPNTKTIVFPISFDGTSCDFRYHERFDINFVTGEWRETPTDGILADKKDWKVIDTSSEETDSEDGRAMNAIDGDINTKWHTRYSNGEGSAPHYITVDMGKDLTIKGFLATPRMDGSTNGLIRKYQFQTSLDGNTWTTVSEGDWLLYATETDFVKRKCRYIKLICTEGSYASLAELDVVLDETSSGIDAVDTPDKTVKSRSYYSLDGRQIEEPSVGLFIEQTRYTDGTVKSVKKYRK